MRLDRNINPGGEGKYALINLRKLREWMQLTTNKDGLELREAIREAINGLRDLGIWCDCAEGTEHEFFAIMLKDRNAAAALGAYAASVLNTSNDTEYADEVLELALRAGPNSKWCKDPD